MKNSVNTIYVIAMPSVEVTETPEMAADRAAHIQRFFDGDLPDPERRPKKFIRPRCRLVLGDVSSKPAVADNESIHASVFLPADGTAGRLFAMHSENMKGVPLSSLAGTEAPDVYLESAEDMVSTLKHYIVLFPCDDYVIRESVTSGDGSRLAQVTSRLSIPL